MWMTGFDAPSVSTIYLDKPMGNHTLMQTIARANRVFGDKVNGLIVEYVGVIREWQKALAIMARQRAVQCVRARALLWTRAGLARRCAKL
jgi:type I restriction enzyme R subunit